MAYQIKWTIPAKDSHENIADYLIQEWSEKEVRNFINIVEDKLQLIAIYPDLFPRTNKRRNIHKVVISKQVVLFYRKHKVKRIVELLVFLDTRRNPSKLKL